MCSRKGGCGRRAQDQKEESVEGKAKIMGHLIHTILIPLPLGLLSTSVIFDIVHLLTGSSEWSEISFWISPL